ncbi:MAG: DUF6152 family protein [Pseudomonadales bacterium]|nr:DUF6152 family protein [Pseudomonadales bacterium]
MSRNTGTFYSRLVALSPLVIALFLGFPLSVFAHHGYGNFALDETIELEGTITRVDFVNPHAWVYFDVLVAGEVQAWRCEMRAATVLRRSGWSKEMFVAGEAIAITASPDRLDSRTCYLSTIVFADGSKAARYGQLEKAPPPQLAEERQRRLPDGTLNISGDWASEQYVMMDAGGQKGSGLVPLSVAQGKVEAANSPSGSPWRVSQVNFTEAGKAAADGFALRSLDNPRMRCETTSIIFDWDFDGPVNRITQQDDSITLQYGQFGFTRTIKLDQTSHPANLEPSRAGHSIGHWEGDVLVVATTGFAPGVLYPPVMNSEHLQVVEHFRLDVDTMTLHRDYVATDPVYYTDAYRGSDSLNLADIPYSPDDCSDFTLINYGKEQGETLP